MSNMKKLFTLAKRAMDSRDTGAGEPSRGGSPHGTTDWRALVHRAADAVTGESRDRAPRSPAPRADSAQAPRGGHGQTPRSAPSAHPAPPTSASPQDRAAVARYTYLLETADPRQLEQVHAEAFAKLTPSQRALLQQDLQRDLPVSERPASAEPADLARAATRGEMRSPGTLRRLLARSGGARGRGAVSSGAAGVAGAGALGLLGVVAGGAVATAIGGSLLAEAAASGVDFDALASGLDPEALLGDFAVGDALAGAGEAVPGVEEAVSGLGDAASSTLDAAQGGLGSIGDAVSGFDLRGFFER